MGAAVATDSVPSGFRLKTRRLIASTAPGSSPLPRATFQIASSWRGVARPPRGGAGAPAGMADAFGVAPPVAGGAAAAGGRPGGPPGGGRRPAAFGVRIGLPGAAGRIGRSA
jgi:hypothetical protein